MPRLARVKERYFEIAMVVIRIVTKALKVRTPDDHELLTTTVDTVDLTGIEKLML